MYELSDIIDILGTVAFAISGVISATKKRMDLFGILIIATVTSVGGGTLRDLLIGKTPVSWMLDIRFVITILVSTFFGILFRKQLHYVRRSLFLFDTIGIALYTVTGVQMGLMIDLNPAICIALGTVTACFGGVLRDILCNEIPVIFRKEIYASACIAGGGVYILLEYYAIALSWSSLIAGLTVILIRSLAVIYELQLPNIYKAASQS